jgi:hypothetical protein
MMKLMMMVKMVRCGWGGGGEGDGMKTYHLFQLDQDRSEV